MIRKLVCGCLVAAIAALTAFSAAGEREILVRAAGISNAAEGEALEAEARRSDPDIGDLVHAIAEHNLAEQNPKLWAEKAVADLQALAKSADPADPADPAGPVALCYWGSALTLRASLRSKAGRLIEALVDLDSGFKKMDAALGASPDSLLLRFLRAENSVSVSEGSPLKRWDVAKGDVAAIDRIAGTSLDAVDRARVLVIRGRVAIGTGDRNGGLRLLEEAARTAPGSKPSATAKKIIQDMEG
jgi:hypothetical protein